MYDAAALIASVFWDVLMLLRSIWLVIFAAIAAAVLAAFWALGRRGERRR